MPSAEEIVAVINAFGETPRDLAAVSMSYVALQWSRGHDWLGRVKQIADLGSDEDATARITSSEETRYAFVLGLELAMHTTWPQARERLAQIVSTTLRDDRWQLDEIALLLRTAAELHPADITVLTELSKPRPDRYANSHFMGAATPDDLVGDLPPDTTHLLTPVLGALNMQGLTVDAALGTWSYGGPRWMLTPYAFKFLRHVSPAGYTDRAEVAGWCHSTAMFVRCLGPGDAELTRVKVTVDDRSVIDIVDRIGLPAGTHHRIDLDNSLPNKVDVHVEFAWTDQSGEHTGQRTYSR